MQEKAAEKAWDFMMGELLWVRVWGVEWGLQATTRSKSAAYRDKSREWNVSKQKWNLC